MCSIKKIYLIFIHNLFCIHSVGRSGEETIFLRIQQIFSKMYGNSFGFFVALFILNYTGNIIAADVYEIIANSSSDIADYFSINCLYFMGNTEEMDDKLFKVLIKPKSDNFKKSVAFCNFTSYYNLLKNKYQDQCQSSLRVNLQIYNTEIDKEFLVFNQIYHNFSKKIRSGAWLIFTNRFEDDFIDKFFKDVYLPFDIEFIIGWISGDKVHLKEVYQVGPTFPKRQPYFGNWSVESKLKAPQKPSLHFRRSDLEGWVFRVGVVDGNEPFTMQNSLSGYFVDIWEILEQLMNASTVFTKFPLKRHKDARKNSWLRIMNGILDKELDVGLADFIPTKERVGSFDFSYPLFFSDFQLYFRIFENEVLSHTLLLPFDNEIWFAVLIWLIINSLMVFWACRISRKFTNSQEIVIQLPTSLFVNFGGLCGQGVSTTPKTSSCRILFLIIFMVAAVMIPSYSASLTRYLTAKPSRVSFRDLRDFYDTNSHTMIVVFGSFEFHSFNISRNRIYEEKIFQRYLKNKNLPKTYHEALRLMCSKEKTALFTISSYFIWEWNKADNKQIRDDCILRKMSNNAGLLVSGMVFPKKFRFKELMDRHLKTLQRTGIINRLKIKYWIPHPKIRGKLWDSVSLQESTAVFEIFIGGIILSVFFLIFERLLLGKPKKVVIKKNRIRFRTDF